jgi:hypothetical protein
LLARHLHPVHRVHRDGGDCRAPDPLALLQPLDGQTKKQSLGLGLRVAGLLLAGLPLLQEPQRPLVPQLLQRSHHLVHHGLDGGPALSWPPLSHLLRQQAAPAEHP